MLTTRFHTLLLFGFLSFFALFHAKPAAAEPVELNLFPKNATFDGLDEQLFPLGWSKNGEHLAVLSARPNEAADERTWECRILDLVADKSLHTETFYIEGSGGIAPFWQANGAKVSALLDTFGIEFDSKPFQLHTFPALAGKYRGESYETVLTRGYAEEPLFGYRGVKHLKLALSNQEGKSKTILDLNYEEFFPIAAGTIGYLPNPQGNRIAVLLALTKRGYEGPPHVRTLLVVGARIGEKF
ncbi:hypothetical protein N9B73_10865 [Verrucomicrobiales bacterium]|nr:hypothetical protein [Verrucomicrobiales bacterium]